MKRLWLFWRPSRLLLRLRPFRQLKRTASDRGSLLVWRRAH
jgi:hypothetical protein